MPPEVATLLAVLIRQALLVMSGAFVAKGWITADNASGQVDAWVPVIVPMVPMALTMAYGLWKSTLRQKIKDILARPKVSSVHVTPELSDKLQVDGVVPTPPNQA